MGLQGHDPHSGFRQRFLSRSSLQLSGRELRVELSEPVCSYTSGYINPWALPEYFQTLSINSDSITGMAEGGNG